MKKNMSPIKGSVKKIIFIGYTPLTQHLYSVFFMKVLSESFNVEYWDLTKVYFPVLFEDVEFENISYRVLYTYRQIESALKEDTVDNSLFILCITYEGRVTKLFRLLTEYRCCMAFFARGMFPLPTPTLSRKVISKLKTLSKDRVKSFLNHKKAYLYKKCRVVKPYDYVFLGGRLAISAIGSGYNVDEANSDIISVNTADYDMYMSMKDKAPLMNKAFAVFVDEYIPYHPDAIICGTTQPSVSAHQYYQQLNHFFSLIETQLQIEVVIAAHPKAIRYKTENMFEGRKVFFNQTALLIRDARFMMVHHSTSIGFAVLSKTPMVFLKSAFLRNYLSERDYGLISYFASYLDAEIVEYDSYTGRSLRFTVNEEKYTQYKYDYMTSPETEDKKTEDIFIEFLHSNQV